MCLGGDQSLVHIGYLVELTVRQVVLFMNRRGTLNSSLVVVHWVSDTNTVSTLLRLSDFDPRRTELVLFFIITLQNIDY